MCVRSSWRSTRMFWPTPVPMSQPFVVINSLINSYANVIKPMNTAGIPIRILQAVLDINSECRLDIHVARTHMRCVAN